MSPKQNSLAVEEVKEHQDKHFDVHMEPKLKVLINKRYIKHSNSATDASPVAIRGRMTVSF